MKNSIIRGKTYLYNYSDAIKIVEWCRKNEILILGIDVLYVSEDITKPYMEYDFKLTDVVEAYDYALKIIELNRGIDLHYEIVY